MSRRICQRGCPLGGYFNANSTLIPWALSTGKLTLKPNSVVHSIIYEIKEKGGMKERFDKEYELVDALKELD